MGIQRHVLVVDDDEDSADLLAESLRDRGLDARVAHDGLAALAMTHGFTADVAVIDIGLPGMDGIELARQLRSQPSLRGVRLVALTGYANVEMHDRLVAVGFDEHLIKPVRLEYLESVIDRLTA